MKKTLKLLTLATCLCFATVPTMAAQKPGTFTTGDKTFLLNGQPFIVKAAEVHYPRIPRPYWEHRIQLCKSLGMNTLCIYVFWNIHDWRRRTACTSSCGLVPTSVPSGKWAVCLGGS